LPKKEFMENAKKIWDELGLPPLKPEAPWFGYSLGDWSERNEQMAQRAVRGDYFVTGEEIAKQRRSDVAMNTEIKGQLELDAARAIASGAKKKSAVKAATASAKKPLAVTKKAVKPKK
jgi:hypothetical protein